MAIGVGAEAGVDGGVIAAAVTGIALAFAFWWTYFDVAALVAAERLAQLGSVKERNELARDAYSYLHLPMVAAVVLVALGMKSTLAHVGDPLSWPTATALVAGAALYLSAHVAFKLRSLGVLAVPRLAGALILLATLPLARRVDALVAVAVVTVVLGCVIAYEAWAYADARREIREAEHVRHSAG